MSGLPEGFVLLVAVGGHVVGGSEFGGSATALERCGAFWLLSLR